MKKSNLLKHVVLPFFLMMISGLVFAQVAPPAVADILGATGPTDKSVAVFTYVLGKFFLSPLSSFGGSDTLIGGLFTIFNGFVFLVGTLWASYGLISGIVETAHSGEVLGKRLSAVWLPIRMVTGIAGIAPIFGGYSLAQVFIVTMAALGIGIANMMWAGAVKMTDGFIALIPPTASMSAASPTGTSSAADVMFQIHVCDQAQSALNTDIDSIDSYSRQQSIVAFSGNDVLAYSSYGTASDPTMCGVSSLRAVDVRASSGWSSMVGFRVGSVDYGQYQQLAEGLKAPAKAAYLALDSAVEQISVAWYKSYGVAVNTAGAPTPQYPQAALDLATKNYQDAILAQMNALTAKQAQSNSTLAKKTSTQMEKDGWFGAGAWFSTFAEANAAMADVMASLSITVSPPNIRTTSPITSVLIAVQNSQNKSGQGDAGNQPRAPTTNVSAANAFAPINAAICKVLGITYSSSSTSNCSVGQLIVRQGIRAAAIGSGGGGNSFFDDVGLINPIVMFKNMGDYSMTVGEAIYGVMALAEMSGLTDAVESKGIIGTVENFVISTIPGGKLLLGALKIVGRVLPLIAGGLLILGLMMSIYIPLIPFITWMGGLVQYCVIVMQGLVGAPIAALSHLDAEGEGLGRRTEAGYMFALNVTFRPALMLLGFFFASAIMIALGSFQANLFMMAMGNAQGNSITGMFSILGYLVVFFVLNVTLIQGLFNMIFLLPDQVLSLIGAGGHMADLGKEVEGKVHNLFLAGARMSSGTRGLIATKPKPKKEPGPAEPGKPG